MAATNRIIGSLDALLDPDRFEDFGPNGLQVPGPPETAHVVTGVSAHLELIDRAAALRADLLLTHHGLFWNAAPRALDGPMARKLRRLFDAELGLAAYHLPLDAHPEHGNNALLAVGLGATRHEPLGAIGRLARFDVPVARDELVARIAALTAREPLAFPAGPAEVRSVGIVSGAGSSFLDAAIAAGCDAFVTGEPTERVMAQAHEAPITFVAAGHHATETFGVRRLGELLAERFAIRHTFVDVPNPI